MWSSYSIENKSMALSYNVYMDENGNLVPQNMTPEFSIHSLSETYEEFRNNNVTLIENNIMIGNTMVNSSAIVINNLNYTVEYIISFDLIGKKSNFAYGSSGYSILNGTSTNISGIPVTWQSSGFLREVKAYSNGTDALILPYAVDLKHGRAFFIDPTVGKKPFGPTCTFQYYGDISATLNAPSSTAYGDTITLSVTINSLSGESSRKVNFYVSGDGQRQKVYSTTVTNGNTYTTSWTDNIVGNLTFCANYLYDKATCIEYYRGHVFIEFSYGYSPLGSKSIHGISIENAIGYMGNGVIYIGSSSNAYENWTIPAKFGTETAYSYSEKCEQNSISVSEIYTENCIDLSNGGGIQVSLDVASAGGIAFYNHPVEPYGIFSYSNISASLGNKNSGLKLVINRCDNSAVNLTLCLAKSGNTVLSGVRTALGIAALVLPSPFDVGAGILSLLVPSGVASNAYKMNSDSQVYEHFVPNPAYMGKSGGTFGIGIYLTLVISPSDYNMTGNSLTIEAQNHVYCENGGATGSYTFPIYPSYVVFGTLYGSNGQGLGGVPLYFRDNANNEVYEITTINKGSHTGHFIFYANQYTNYTIWYGNDFIPLKTFTTGSFG